MELSAIVAFFLAVRSVRLGCVIPFVHGAGILTSFGFFSWMMENVPSISERQSPSFSCEKKSFFFCEYVVPTCFGFDGELGRNVVVYGIIDVDAGSRISRSRV
jgi:hypothetical protein